MTGNQEEKYTILYARLSEEDARAGRSISIEHQEQLLRKCAAEKGLDNLLFLYDDGITGTMDKRQTSRRPCSWSLRGRLRRLS